MSTPMLITIAGPTASGKTAIGVRIAALLSGEILSADSRQVYRRMDIGTGKDIREYTLPDGTVIPHHLIDIVEPGVTFDLYRWKEVFDSAYDSILSRGRTPILVGGSGLYIETALGGRTLTDAPKNQVLRDDLSQLSHKDLLNILNRFGSKPQADISSVRRTIRAIEIASYYARYPEQAATLKEQKATLLPHLLCCLILDPTYRRERIGKRLHARLEEGMIEEVRQLLNEGVPAEALIQYGLEYKHITHYLQGRVSLDTMIAELEIAIRQFAKRQMTWFRGMERRGFSPIYIDATLSPDEIVAKILSELQKASEHSSILGGENTPMV